MARPKKIIEQVKEVFFKETKKAVEPTKEVVAPKFDPSIPENKQRHLR
jgi:hypothetical protein